MDITSVYKAAMSSNSRPPEKFRRAGFVYLDSNATTPLLPEARLVMEEFYFDNFANPSSSHAAGLRAKRSVEEARGEIARLINAESSEIFFTSGASESLNMATLGLNSLKPENCGNRVIAVSSIEHHASLYPALELEKHGARVLNINPTIDGDIDCGAFENEIKTKGGSRLDFASFMLVNNETGVIQPVKKLVDVAKQYGATFLCDAVQGPGKVDIDVQALGVDLMAFSAHKFYGPKGIGILYARRGVRLNPRTLGGSHESGLRAGTLNVAAICAMAVSLKKAVEERREREKHYALLKKYLYNKFVIFEKNNIEYRLNSPDAKTISSAVNVGFKNVSAEALVEFLSNRNIMVSAGSACASKRGAKVSHVLDSMNVPLEFAMGSIRISFGIYNEPCDIDKLCASILEFVKPVS